MSKILKLLSPRDLACLWQMHPHTISRALCGQLTIDLPPDFKIGGQWRFREDDVEEHLNRLSGRPTAQTSAGTAAVATDVPPNFTKRKPGRPRKLAPAFKQGAAE